MIEPISFPFSEQQQQLNIWTGEFCDCHYPSRIIRIPNFSVHVVFGKVISGHEIISEIEGTAVDKKARPLEPVLISDCGEIPQQEEQPSDSESDHKNKKKERKKRKKDKKDKKHKKHKKEKRE
jgi:cyclophilin family peptidyl-prolyl cis-trans isomerase